MTTETSFRSKSASDRLFSRLSMWEVSGKIARIIVASKRGIQCHGLSSFLKKRQPDRAAHGDLLRRLQPGSLALKAFEQRFMRRQFRAADRNRRAIRGPHRSCPSRGQIGTASATLGGTAALRTTCATAASAAWSSSSTSCSKPTNCQRLPSPSPRRRCAGAGRRSINIPLGLEDAMRLLQGMNHALMGHSSEYPGEHDDIE